MRKQTTLQFLCIALMALFAFGQGFAFDASQYATTSKLATGKWVKISIPENGVYELTYDELTQMGFSNPENVRIYGHGGLPISEILDGNAIDDLQPVPVSRFDNKICFYGNGPVKFSIGNYSTTPHYTRAVNGYDQVGCYFLTEETSAETSVQAASQVTVSSPTDVATSLAYFWHEKDLVSIGLTGKQMLGEDFKSDDVLIDYTLPEIADSTIVVQTAIGAYVSEKSYVTAYIHSQNAVDTMSYGSSSSAIYVPSSTAYYREASPYAKIQLTAPAETGQFQPALKLGSTSTTLSIARLDYFIITYTRNNVISDKDNGQIQMGFVSVNGKERFLLPNANENIVVWDISNRYQPTHVTTTSYSNSTGSGQAFFGTGSRANTIDYVAFDPTQTLKKIVAYEAVDNQNIHSMATPNMVIITNKYFYDQAQRIADLHAAVDGKTVQVVTQDQVFNEFSSGTRDGMAYRLMCKMFYDRDANTFKNLLLFGPGTYDNRQVLGEHPTYLLTYQSDLSYDEGSSFVCDDFFALLTDNSGYSMSTDQVSIGVGRFPVVSLEEATADVDKYVEYYGAPDYGSWRNNTLVSSDKGDSGLHLFQAEGVTQLIDNELGTNMQVNKVHTAMFPRSTTEPSVDVSKRTATEAKKHMTELFKSGQYYATYVGHAGSTGMTKSNALWTNSDVSNVTFNHYPIYATACCDVARYDSGSRGICEAMFHKRNGGAIALLTSTRLVYASANDELNRNFATALFSFAANDSMPTLGQAYRIAKNNTAGTSTNKLSFSLFGDPAMDINYPKPYFVITKVNGTDVTQDGIASIGPLQQFSIEAQVMDADNTNINTDFNGDATITLYDCAKFFQSLTYSNKTIDVTYERAKLAEISGRVTNGVFSGTMIVPASVSANNENVLLRAYAHLDNSKEMVNGLTENILMLPYDEQTAISDDQAPVITAMYINDEESFSNGDMVAESSTLYITATDDYALSVQANSVTNKMTLVLDGGKKSYSEIEGYVTLSDNAKTLNITFPLLNIADGTHTLTYTVYDVAGNYATKTITFTVGQSHDATLSADAMPAILNQDVNFDFTTSLTSTPEVTVRVTDATGKLVWKTTTTSFPITWDLKDNDGNYVAPGLYRYFGTYSDGNNYGGTTINNMVVLDALKSNKE